MNRIGIFYVELGLPSMSALMAKSVYYAKQIAPVTQFTSMTSRAFHVDTVVRRPTLELGLMQSRIDHFAQCDEPMLFIDPDVRIMDATVFDLFDQDFDVALTKRDKIIMREEGGRDAVKEMPYNTGVIFHRNRDFWRAVLEQMQPMPLSDRQWFGDQKAVAIVARSGDFKVLELPCEVYNYTPSHQAEDVSQKKIVHYKGDRKKWMLK